MSNRIKKRSFTNYSKETLVAYLREYVERNPFYYHSWEVLDVLEVTATSKRYWARLDSVNKRLEKLKEQPNTVQRSREMNRLYDEHKKLCEGLSRFTAKVKKQNA